jgi:DNA polymerase-3 subunit gamma/tau
MLLKCLIEVRDAVRPIAAAEMALVRLAYAADLPPTDKLVRDVMERAESTPTPVPTSRPARPGPAPNATTSRGGEAASAQARPLAETEAARRPAPAEPVALHSLAEIAGLAGLKGAAVLKVQIENHMHLVRLETGQIEFRPGLGAPRTLASDLAQKLKEWTGFRWVVTLAREGGEPTLAEQKKAARAEKLEMVAQEPLVRAVLDRFPGAEIVAVRERADRDIAPPTDES